MLTMIKKIRMYNIAIKIHATGNTYATWSKVRLADEFMGVFNLTSCLPQYLMTATAAYVIKESIMYCSVLSDAYFNSMQLHHVDIIVISSMSNKPLTVGWRGERL